MIAAVIVALGLANDLQPVFKYQHDGQLAQIRADLHDHVQMADSSFKRVADELKYQRIKDEVSELKRDKSRNPDQWTEEDQFE